MECPSCNQPMYLEYAYNKITGDNSPDTPTKLYRVLMHRCVNNDCQDYYKIVEQPLPEFIGNPKRNQ